MLLHRSTAVACLPLVGLALLSGVISHSAEPSAPATAAVTVDFDREVRPILADVIHAAETTDTAAIRKAQLALVDKLKSKGPGYQRDLKVWGYVAQGAIGVTCVVLATISLSAAGLPCVIGGAATSAALNYYAAQ